MLQHPPPACSSSYSIIYYLRDSNVIWSTIARTTLGEASPSSTNWGGLSGNPPDAAPLRWMRATWAPPPCPTQRCSASRVRKKYLKDCPCTGHRVCGILLYSHCTMVPNASSTMGSPLKGRGKCTWPVFSSLLRYGWYLSLLLCSSRARPGREPYRNLHVQVPGYTTDRLTKIFVKGMLYAQARSCPYLFVSYMIGSRTQHVRTRIRGRGSRVVPRANGDGTQARGHAQNRIGSHLCHTCPKCACLARTWRSGMACGESQGCSTHL